MTTVAGIQIPDNIYQSMVNVMQTQQNILKSANIPGLGTVCAPFSWLGPLAPLVAPQPLGVVCGTADAIIDAAYAQVMGLIQQGWQQITSIEEQAKANGEKVKSVTVRYYAKNSLLTWAETVMTEVYNILNQLSPQQISYILTHITSILNPQQYAQQQAQQIFNSMVQAQQFIVNLVKQILQAGANAFNNDTLQQVNAQLNPIGWNLQPITVGYDDTNNVVYVEATFEEIGSPDLPVAAIAVGLIVLAIILAIAAIFWMNYNATIQTLNTEKQLPGIIAQSTNNVLNNCMQTINNVQICTNLANEYLSSVQNAENTASQTGKGSQLSSILGSIQNTVITIAVVGVAAGAAIIVLDYLKHREENESFTNYMKRKLSS